MMVCNFFEEDNCVIQKTVYQVIEQNHTSGAEAFQTEKEQLNKDGIYFKSIISVRSDNVNYMYDGRYRLSVKN